MPALIAREVLLRATPLERVKMITTLRMGVCTGISALYEWFACAAAKLTDTAADAFLGSQGDVFGHTMGNDVVPDRGHLRAPFITRLHLRWLAGLRAS